MKIVPPEPSVKLYKDCFEERDILQRKRLGDALSDLLNRIEDPLVVALDGRWGTGKTYFLKRWVGAHARRYEGDVAAVVYFDAFAHDSLGDPLPALVSALEERILRSGADNPKEGQKKKIQAVKEAAFRLMKPLARAGLNASGADIIVNVVDELAKARIEEVEDSFDRFWDTEKGRRDAMEKFREAIESLAASKESSGTGSTVVIVVDELDRCRPDYALEVIEVIKHFFTVPRLHFVLGVNLRALEDMVRARYGFKIDAHAYLSKFIQVTLDLPDEFTDDTNRQMQAVMVYFDHLRKGMGIPQKIADPLRKQVEIVSRANHVSLRDVGSIVSSVSLASGEVVENPENKEYFHGWIMVMIDLIVSRVVRPDLHPRFLDATVTPSDLESYLGANENVLQEYLGGQRNPDYDHDISLRFNAWRFLARNGQITDDDPELYRQIPHLFGDHGILVGRTPRRIPMKVHRQWLDRFSFNRSN